MKKGWKFLFTFVIVIGIYYGLRNNGPLLPFIQDNASWNQMAPTSNVQTVAPSSQGQAGQTGAQGSQKQSNQAVSISPPIQRVNATASNSQSEATSKISSKNKTTVAVDDPLLSCSTKQDVCEKADLPPNQEFSYSQYIWANAGESITFGGSTKGMQNVGIWIESEDGTFSSDVHIIKPNKTNTFMVDAPFDGNFRVVLQNKSKKGSSPVNAYIKDSWSK